MAKTVGQAKALLEYPEIMTPKDIAEYLGVGYVKALNLVKYGNIPCIRIGNSFKISRSSFLAWLEQPGLREVL